MRLFDNSKVGILKSIITCPEIGQQHTSFPEVKGKALGTRLATSPSPQLKRAIGQLPHLNGF